MPKTDKQLVSISVKFKILTPDQLKQIVFGLSKSTNDDVDTWVISFELSTRTSATKDFAKMIEATVNADLKDTEKAEETATRGPNQPQSDHLTLNVATAGERLAAGKIKQPVFDRTLKATLPARDA